MHLDVLDQGGRSFPGAHRGEFVHHEIDTFFHRHFCLEKNVVLGHKKILARANPNRKPTSRFFAPALRHECSQAGSC